MARDPYDPILVTEMLQLGLDPVTLVTEERLRRRELRTLTNTEAYEFVKYLNDHDIAFTLGQLRSDHLEFACTIDFNKEELARLRIARLIYIGSSTSMFSIIGGPPGLYQDIIDSDLLINGNPCQVPKYVSRYSSVLRPPKGWIYPRIGNATL